MKYKVLGAREFDQQEVIDFAKMWGLGELGSRVPSRLDIRAYTLCVLHFGFGMKYSEIARALGVGEDRAGSLRIRNSVLKGKEYWGDLKFMRHTREVRELFPLNMPLVIDYPSDDICVDLALDYADLAYLETIRKSRKMLANKSFSELVKFAIKNYSLSLSPAV